MQHSYPERHVTLALYPGRMGGETHGLSTMLCKLYLWTTSHANLVSFIPHAMNDLSCRIQSVNITEAALSAIGHVNRHENASDVCQVGGIKRPRKQ